MSLKPLMGWTLFALASFIALFLIRMLQLPTVYMFVILLLWIASVLAFSRRADMSRFGFWWTWRGGLMWLGSILVATGIVVLINWVRGAPMTWEQWSGLVTGFLLAYALGFLLYLVIARGDRRST